MSVQLTLSGFFKDFTKGLLDQLETSNGVRERVVDDSATSFTRWHRAELPGWYTWTDIDYVGYQDDEVYVLIDYIKVPEDRFDEAPECYPLWDHQRNIYQALAAAVGCHAFVMWYTDRLDQFAVSEIGSDQVTWLDGKHGFCDFLDEYR